MRKVDFVAKDGVQLTGLLYDSAQEKENIIIAVHGMSSNCFKKRDDVISKKANDNGIDYFCFNNRGSDLVKYIRKRVDGKRQKILGGTSVEDVRESYYDIVGAILKMKELGYTNIYLQGHSLGSTKVVYTYSRLLEESNIEILSNIKGIILLSLVDIPTVLKFFLKDKTEEYTKLAEEKVNKGQGIEFMPADSFIHPISAKTFLQYVKYNDEFDFINILKDEKLNVLNNINIPLFMRWGNVQEMIMQEAEVYSKKVREIIRNENADIDYIDGADHGYHGKEELLATQIMNFITKN